MATPYEAIYEKAMFRITDTRFSRLNPSDQKSILDKLLHQALSDFVNKCGTDLTDRDDVAHVFNNDLTDEEQEILALGIAYYWLSFQILNTELLRNKLSTKDYQYFSPANLVRETTILREQVQTEYKHRIVNYTFDHGDLAHPGAGD